jgi:hypothetical protein
VVRVVPFASTVNATFADGAPVTFADARRAWRRTVRGRLQGERERRRRPARVVGAVASTTVPP